MSLQALTDGAHQIVFRAGLGQVADIFRALAMADREVRAVTGEKNNFQIRPAGPEPLG